MKGKMKMNISKLISLILAFIMAATLTPSLCLVYADEEEVQNPVVTAVTTNKPAVQWNDWIDITIEYQAASEPTEVLLEFDTPANPIYHSTVRLNEDFNLENDYSYMDVTILKSHAFDAATGKGSITYRRKLRSSDRAGSYELYSMEGYIYDGSRWQNKKFTIPANLGGFDVETPFGLSVFDKEYFRDDLISSLESLQDGDVAVVRCDNSLTDAHYNEEGEVDLYRWYLLKKEYLDAVKGKDVTIVFPVTGCIAVVNGKDISSETKDVDFGGGLSVHINFVSNDTVYFYFYFKYPDNGELPCTFRYMYDYNENLDFFLEGSRDAEFAFTKADFNNHIDNALIYCYDDGSFISEDTGFKRNNLWIWFDLDHNSSFVGTDSSPKKLCSFQASLKSSRLTYNGKVQKPSLKVTSDLDLPYSVNYSNKNSKSVGKYKITVKGIKGGFGQRTFTYQIFPKGTSIKVISPTKKGFTVKWKKQTVQTTGYQIQYATNSKFTTRKKTLTIKSNKTLSKKITSLKGGKKYYVRVRTYKIVNGIKYYSDWSAKKTVITRKK